MSPARRERIRITHEAVDALRGLPRKVALRYMGNWSDMDIRDELKITVSALDHARGDIRRALIDAGVTGGSEKWRV